MDEARLIEKLRAIEALFAGATTPGERVAADRARQRIKERIKELEQEDPPVEYRFSMPDMWSKRVFLALCRRYGLEPYRYAGQRHTSVMVRVSHGFAKTTLWPEFQEIMESLKAYLSEVTDRVVAEVLHQDASDARVVDARQLPAAFEGPADDDEEDLRPDPSPQGPPAGNRAARRAAEASRRGKRRR